MRMQIIYEIILEILSEGAEWVVKEPIDDKIFVLGCVTYVGVCVYVNMMDDVDFFPIQAEPELITGYLTGFYTHNNLWQSCYLRRNIGRIRHLNMSEEVNYNRSLFQFYREYSDLILHFHYTHPASSEFLIMCLPIHW